MIRLQELDIAENEFKRFPEVPFSVSTTVDQNIFLINLCSPFQVVFLLPSLRRLNLSDNEITTIPE